MNWVGEWGTKSPIMEVVDGEAIDLGLGFLD